MTEHIGPIGLGAMGDGMSRNLLAAGYERAADASLVKVYEQLAGIDVAAAAE